ELDSEVAHALPGLDKGAPDVVIADQTEAERDTAFSGIAHSGSHAGIRHGYHHIGFGRSFAGELSAEGFPAVLHSPAEHQAVRTREIYVFKNAARLCQSG